MEIGKENPHGKTPRSQSKGSQRIKGFFNSPSGAFFATKPKSLKLLSAFSKASCHSAPDAESISCHSAPDAESISCHSAPDAESISCHSAPDAESISCHSALDAESITRKHLDSRYPLSRAQASRE